MTLAVYEAPRGYGRYKTTNGCITVKDVQDVRRVYRIVHEIFEERIPFNRVLGLKIDHLADDRASFRFEMRHELVGNYQRNMLHGGVIAAALDVTGGLLAFVGVVKRMRGRSEEEIKARFERVGTIDMRVDYLRPGIGKHFVASAAVLRSGRRVAVMRTELHDERGDLIATGTCAYMVS